VLSWCCQDKGIPILRRCSGGGTVVQGPGCLNYSLVLEIAKTEALASIPATNRYVMEAHRQLFQSLTGAEVKVSGHTDLALNTRKFSGNAQRRKRRWLLFHGTFLLAFDLASIERLLAVPSHQPAYRSNRGHTDFVCNVELPANKVKEGLCRRWNAGSAFTDPPHELIAQLVREKYSRAEWNLRP
jgi:lipoate---protein ligase